MFIVEPDRCSGCRVCLQVCSAKAVSSYTDEYGFEQVRIDDVKCRKCGRCSAVCPMLHPRKEQTHYLCGSAYAKDDSVRSVCSSGGLFGIFARKVIKEKGGVVYGAAFDKELRLRTMRADDENQLEKLYKSKYFLCDTGDSFSKIRADLESGRVVLYCSSPCQVSALKGYLNREYPNLIAVDFICHGVGAQKQFDDSIRYIEKRNGIEVLDFVFRSKAANLSSKYYYVYNYKKTSTGKVGNKRDIYMTFPYYYAYEKSLTYREACYSCPFAAKERVGDITIGDFHQIEKYQPEIDRFAGVSMFMCNTEKGSRFFDEVKDRLKIVEYQKEVLFQNNRFSGPETPPFEREQYLQALSQGKEYSLIVKEFFSYGKDWRYYYYHTPKWLRVIGRKLFRR